MNVILYNGLIYPQTPTRRRPSLVVISQSHIAAVGYDIKAARRQFPKHELINLHGRAVIPGLVDSHTHFYFWAMTLDTVHLDDAKDFDEVLKRINKFRQKLEPGEWIVGDGWSADRWSKYHLPTAADLDKVTGKNPAALYSKDQHSMWVNSEALLRAGIDKNSRNPNGGQIDRDPITGRPTGILREIPGYYPVIKLLNSPDQGSSEKVWKRAARIARSRGVTGFHSMDVPAAYDFFKSLHNRGKLDFRVCYYYPVRMTDELIERKIISGDGDGVLKIGGVKLFSDGALGSQTGLMKKPYLGNKNNYGLAVTTCDELQKQISKASKHNLVTAVHAIGDKAVDNVLAAFESLPEPTRLRHRIEHLQLISRGDISRLRKIGAIASMQPSHCPSDRGLIKSYWGARGKNAYIFKTLLSENIPLAFGSDCPIEPLDPLGGISCAVNRTGFGERGGKFYPAESLTVSQALYGFTTGAAYASGWESSLGKIASGYLADLVILEDNIFTVPPSQIYKSRVAATIFNGKITYRNKQSSLWRS